MFAPTEISPNGQRPPANGRVLIIGLDGATFDLIEPWAAAGHLPNMARLMDKGAWGRLNSTIPAHSGPAWASFATGVLPGKHGVYFFLGPSRDEQYFRPLSADTIRGRRFWELAGDQGRTVGIVNVPLTFPLRPVNGYLIAGLFAPDAASAFSSPELYQEVMAHVGGYVVEANDSRSRQTYLDDMMEGMRLRCKTAEYLMDHHPTDLMVVVFRMIDSIMHNYWGDLDPHHPLRAQLGDNLIPNAILDAYRYLDEAVGRLVDKAGSDTTVFIMSDHGFRAEYKRYSVNKWLREQGLLTLKRGRGPLTTMIGLLVKRLGLAKLAKRTLHQMTGAAWQQAAWASVDWTRTQVVYGPGPAFYVNLQGRDAQGIVSPAEYEPLRQRLMTEFKKLRDPENGLPIVAEVYRPEDIYQGEAIDLAPDLVPEPAEYVTDGRRWGYGFEPFPAATWDYRTLPRYAGAHAQEGIFIAYGPQIANGSDKNVHIADLAPTTLYAMGLPVPAAMDGQVRTELFNESRLGANPVQYSELEIASEGRSGQVMADEDEARVEARLRELGYL
ncbi:MAG: alkaline phosphatase family protein [Chloroflexota bacterium]